MKKREVGSKSNPNRTKNSIWQTLPGITLFGVFLSLLILSCKTSSIPISHEPTFKSAQIPIHGNTSHEFLSLTLYPDSHIVEVSDTPYKDFWYCLTSLKNEGQDSVIIMGRVGVTYKTTLYHTFYASIKKEGELYEGWKKSRTRFRMRRHLEEDMIILYPGDSLLYDAMILPHYQMEPPGTYEITLWYGPKPIEEWGYYPGKPVASNPIEVRVVKKQ